MAAGPAPPRRATGAINREKDLERIALENERLAMRLFGALDGAPGAVTFSQNPVFEKQRMKSHSEAINRQRAGDACRRRSSAGAPARSTMPGTCSSSRHPGAW